MWRNLNIHLKYADSITLSISISGDMYLIPSSLVLVKNGNDFVALENDPEKLHLL